MPFKEVPIRFIRSVWYHVPFIRTPKAWVSRRRIKKWISRPGLKLVNFGSGHHRLSGWINADISPRADFYIDARKTLPFPDGSLDAAFSEHFIEHLEYGDSILWLSECFRCLRSGGVFRVATPGLEQIVELYLGTSPFVDTATAVRRHFSRFESQIRAAYGADCPQHVCIVANDKLRLWGHHRFIFDEDLLQTLLRAVGFKKIHSVQYGESELPHMRGLEKHAENEKWMEQAECVILEATKP